MYKLLSIFCFVAAPLFMVWSIRYWENPASYSIFVALLVLGIIFSTRKTKAIDLDDGAYSEEQRQEVINKAQKPMPVIFSPVLYLGALFVLIVLFIGFT